MKNLLLSFGLTIGGLITALIVLELGMRVVERGSVTPRWSDRPPFYFQQEAAPTLQDYAYDPVKAPDTFRIAVVGDSFTFAPLMQFTDAFPKKLEQMLNLNTTPKHAQVINYGVPAYSTTHEVAKVEQAIREQADLIILQITLNDPEVKPVAPTGITGGSRFAPLEFTGRDAWLAKHWHTWRWLRMRLHNQKTHQEYTDYFLNLYKDPDSFVPYKAAMKRIATLARESNTKIVAVVFPLFGLPMDEKYPFYWIHEVIGKLMTDLKIPYLDLSEIYKGIPLERLQVVPGIDRHPNEIGHRMAAEQIYLWLTETGVLPPELVIRRAFTGRTRITGEESWQRSAPTN